VRDPIAGSDGIGYAHLGEAAKPPAGLIRLQRGRDLLARGLPSTPAALKPGRKLLLSSIAQTLLPARVARHWLGHLDETLCAFW
jgi:hypothetical protein